MDELASKKNLAVAVTDKKENQQNPKPEYEETIYSFEEVVQETKKYFGGDELAATVWANKYALKDSKGNIYERTPDDMHRRIAREIARIESKYPNPLTEDEIFSMLFPRILAVAELMWRSPETRDYESFQAEVFSMEDYWNSAGVIYGPYIANKARPNNPMQATPNGAPDEWPSTDG